MYHLLLLNSTCLAMLSFALYFVLNLVVTLIILLTNFVIRIIDLMQAGFGKQQLEQQ